MKLSINTSAVEEAARKEFNKKAESIIDKVEYGGRFQANWVQILSDELFDFANSYHSNQFAEYEKVKLFDMQYYMEYCQREGYITPQDWLDNHKHY